MSVVDEPEKLTLAVRLQQMRKLSAIIIVLLATLCGLKVGEVCALVWRDVHVGDGTLRVRFARGTRVREVRISRDLQSFLDEGVRRC